MDRPPIESAPKVPPPRSRREVWLGGSRCDPLDEHHCCAQSLAKWSGRVLGGSCRRDPQDHVIAIDEQRLKRLMVFLCDGLQKQTRTGESGIRRSPQGGVTARPRLGGLHHRYARAAWMRFKELKRTRPSGRRIAPPVR